MSIQIRKLSDYRKAKILLENNSGEMFEIEKIIPIMIKSMTMNVDYSRPGLLEVDIKLVIDRGPNGEYITLDPNKDYLLVEV